MAKVIDLAYEFGVKVIKLCQELPKNSVGFAISGQLVRSATSIGANIEEAQDAMSRADFLKCMNIALKEARETKYWLRIIVGAKLTAVTRIDSYSNEADELVKMLTRIVKTTKERMGKSN